MAAPRQLEIWPAKRLTAAQRRELIRTRLRGFEYRQDARAEQRRRIRERRYARERGAKDERSLGPRQITIFGLTDPP